MTKSFYQDFTFQRVEFGQNNTLSHLVTPKVVTISLYYILIIFSIYLNINKKVFVTFSHDLSRD